MNNSYVALDIDFKKQTIRFLAWRPTKKECQSKAEKRSKNSIKIIPFNNHFNMAIESWLMEYGLDKDTIVDITKVILSQMEKLNK